MKVSDVGIYLRVVWWDWSKCPAFTCILFFLKRRQYEEVTFNGLTPFSVITHNSLNLCV